MEAAKPLVAIERRVESRGNEDRSELDQALLVARAPSNPFRTARVKDLSSHAIHEEWSWT